MKGYFSLYPLFFDCYWGGLADIPVFFKVLDRMIRTPNASLVDVLVFKSFIKYNAASLRFGVVVQY